MIFFSNFKRFGCFVKFLIKTIQDRLRSSYIWFNSTAFTFLHLFHWVSDQQVFRAKNLCALHCRFFEALWMVRSFVCFFWLEMKVWNFGTYRTFGVFWKKLVIIPAINKLHFLGKKFCFRKSDSSLVTMGPRQVFSKLSKRKTSKFTFFRGLSQIFPVNEYASTLLNLWTNCQNSTAIITRCFRCSTFFGWKNSEKRWHCASVCWL